MISDCNLGTTHADASDPLGPLGPLACHWESRPEADIRGAPPPAIGSAGSRLQSPHWSWETKSSVSERITRTVPEVSGPEANGAPDNGRGWPQ